MRFSQCTIHEREYSTLKFTIYFLLSTCKMQQSFATKQKYFFHWALEKCSKSFATKQPYFTVKQRQLQIASPSLERALNFHDTAQKVQKDICFNFVQEIYHQGTGWQFHSSINEARSELRILK